MEVAGIIWLPQWISDTYARLEPLQNSARAKWEKDFMKYADKFLAGKCWCGRTLIEGVCSAQEGGCNKRPLGHKPSVPISSTCMCIPFRPSGAAEKPKVPANNVLTATARNPVAAPPHIWRRPTPESGAPKNSFVQAVHNRIARNLNCNIIFYGGPGDRKSYSALRWLEEIDSSFRGQVALSRLIYTHADCVKWLSAGALKKGQAALIDEGGTLWNSRASSTAMNRYLSDVFITNRQDCSIIALCVPTLEMLDVNVKRLAHFIVHSVGGPSGYAVNKIQRLKYVPDAKDLGGYFKRELLKNPQSRRPIQWFAVNKPLYIPLTSSDGDPNYESIKFKARQGLDEKWEKYFSRLKKYEDKMIEGVYGDDDQKRRALRPRLSGGQ